MAKPATRKGAGPVVLALGPGSEGAELIAEAQGLALVSDRGLACVTVEDGRSLTEEAEARLVDLHELARRGGAKVERLRGVDVAAAIADYAEAEDAPAVIVGCGVGRGDRRSIASRLRRARRGFAVIVVSPAIGGWTRKARGRRPWLEGSPLHYLEALLMVALVSGLALALASYSGYWSAAILYLAAISLGALWLESGPVLLAALAFAAAWDFLFIPPRFTFTITRPEDILMLCLFVVVSLCSGLATSRLRSSEGLLRKEASELARLHELATKLAGAGSRSEILSRGLGAIREEIDCKAIVMLRKEDGSLESQPESGWEALGASARSAADLAFREGGSAGRFTRRERDSEWRFEALESPAGRLGVVGLRPARDADWDEGMAASIRSIVSTMAMALARA